MKQDKFRWISLVVGLLVLCQTVTVWGALPGWLTAMGVTEELWEKYTGAGITIGIVDDSMYMTHPGYASRVWTDECVSMSSTIGAGNIVTTTTTSGSNATAGEWHGTFVAGCAGADWGGENIYGTAKGANLVGIKSDLGFFTTVKAISYEGAHHTDIKNNSYGVSVGYTGVFTATGGYGSIVEGYGGNIASEYSSIQAIDEVTAANTILVYAAGNERNKTDWNCKDCNKKMYQSSAQTITVAALNETYDKYSDFSCYGACVTVCAPGTQVSSTYPPNYNATADGTSFSSPFVSGVLAMAAEAVEKNNPHVDTLNTRLAKHLLAETSTKVDHGLSNTDERSRWTTNAAGYEFSNSYGFGEVNATALTAAAETTYGVTDQSILTTYITGYGEGVSVSKVEEMAYLSGLTYTPDGSGAGEADLSSTALTLQEIDAKAVDIALAPGTATTLADGGTLVESYSLEYDESVFELAGTELQNLEEFGLTIAVSGTLSDMRIEVSHLSMLDDGPFTTTSVILFEDEVSPTTTDTIVWTATSNAFWGEDPTGQWDINVYDMYGESGIEVISLASTMRMGKMKVMVETPEPATWILMLLGSAFLFVRTRRRARQ